MLGELSNRAPTPMMVRLAIREVAALVKVIETSSDAEFVRRWSRSTITNAMYTVRPSERIMTLVKQAQHDTHTLAALLSQTCLKSTSGHIEELRKNAVQSVRNLIQGLD
jgi:hypothetical protein